MITPNRRREQTSRSAALWARWGLGVVAAWALLALASGAAESSVRRLYNVPESDATISLKLFSEQSGLEIIYPAEQVKGVKTNAVKGKFTPREAVDRLVAGTPLTVTSAKSGAMAINRTSDPKAQGKRQQKTTQVTLPDCNGACGRVAKTILRNRKTDGGGTATGGLGAGNLTR